MPKRCDHAHAAADFTGHRRSPNLPVMKFPLHIRALEESFLIKDDSGMLVCAVYFSDEQGRRNSTGRMDRETAEVTAKRIARLLTESISDGEH